MSTNNKSKRFIVWGFKYLPAITAFIMFVHVIAVICGTRLYIAENIAGISIIPAIYFIVLSHQMGFCLLHQSYICYTVLVDVSIQANRFKMLGDFQHCYITLLALFGSVIWFVSFYKFRKWLYSKL